jgi:hypothetical protein
MRKKSAVELPELMTKQHVAAYFSVCTKTVERMMADGLKSSKIRGKRYIAKEHLIDYISRSSQSA